MPRPKSPGTKVGPWLLNSGRFAAKGENMQPKEPVNAEGLTYQEWKSAAGQGYAPDSKEIKRRWEAGEDPCEMRAEMGKK